MVDNQNIIPPYYLYIIVAASAVGKSELMRQMQEKKLWEGVPKYSTRDVRYKNGEIDDVKELDNKQIKELPEGERQEARRERIWSLKKNVMKGKVSFITRMEICMELLWRKYCQFWKGRML